MYIQTDIYLYIDMYLNNNSTIFHFNSSTIKNVSLCIDTKSNHTNEIVINGYWMLKIVINRLIDRS